MAIALLALLFLVADLFIYRQFVDSYGPLSIIALFAVAFYGAIWSLNRVDWRRLRMVKVVIDESNKSKIQPEWLRPTNPNPLVSFFSTSPPIIKSSNSSHASVGKTGYVDTMASSNGKSVPAGKEPSGLNVSEKVSKVVAQDKKSFLIWMLLFGLAYLYVNNPVAFGKVIAGAFSAIQMGLYLLLLVFMMIIQFVAIFWFMAKSKMAQILPGDKDTITFDDYKGQPKLVEYGRNLAVQITNWEEFVKIGGRIPSGAVLHGVPGGGKSYFAKALAGECNRLSQISKDGIVRGVAFLGIEGSSFRGMFWGVDTLKVMEFFGKLRSLARKYGAPSIGFIDELDAVGMSRGGVAGQGGTAGLGGGGMFGGTSGALTRILYELDSLKETGWTERYQRRFKEALGFPDLSPLVRFYVLGATNRPDVLDPALIRSGRLEQMFVVGPPDSSGRRELIKYELSKVHYDDSFDDDAIEAIVHDTQGNTPADLMSAITTGAVQIAVSEGRDKISFIDVDRALERKMFGLEQPIEEMDPEQLGSISAHESGHAVTAHYELPGHRLVRLTTVRHGSALGYLYHTREKEAHALALDEMVRSIRVSYAGHIAAAIYRKELWTGGAGGDFTHVHLHALKLAMSAYFGPPVPEGTDLAQLLGNKRVLSFLKEQERLTEELLIEHWPEVLALTNLLLEKERLINRDIVSVLGRNSVGQGTRVSTKDDDELRAEARKVVEKLRAEAAERQKEPWGMEQPPQVKMEMPSA